MLLNRRAKRGKAQIVGIPVPPCASFRACGGALRRRMGIAVRSWRTTARRRGPGI